MNNGIIKLNYDKVLAEFKAKYNIIIDDDGEFKADKKITPENAASYLRSMFEKGIETGKDVYKKGTKSEDSIKKELENQPTLKEIIKLDNGIGIDFVPYKISPDIITKDALEELVDNYEPIKDSKIDEVNTVNVIKAGHRAYWRGVGLAAYIKDLEASGPPIRGGPW